jgi:hypothetical protein
MTPLPGSVSITTVNENPVYDPSEAIDQHFIVGATQKGPTEKAIRTFSLSQWVEKFGSAVVGSNMYQAARTFFAEGGKALVTMREVGPTPVKASRSVKNGTAKAVFTLEALFYGEYANSYTTQFTAEGGGVKLVIKEGAKTLAESKELTTLAAIVAFVQSTGLMTATLTGEAGLPAADGAPVALAGGTDDSVHATNTNTAAAAALIDRRNGPGTISFPGKTSEEAHALLVEHHNMFDRVGLADLVDSGVGGTLTAGIAAARALSGCEGVAASAPWVITPDGFTAPPSPFVAAKIAQQFLATGDPNKPAAGTDGEADWITGLTQDFSGATREALDAGAVNAIRDVTGTGVIQLFGYDTLANPETAPLQTALSNALLDMLIRWRSRNIGKSLAFKEIDPQGHLASRYAGRLAAMLEKMEGDGAIYAYKVDVESVNNAETAQKKELKARIGIQRSQYSKFIYLEVTNYAIGAAINV